MNLTVSRDRPLAHESGFTLMELVVVVVILGILFGAALPRLEGISPKYRLRAAARELGAQINWIRSTAGATGETFHLHYDLDNRRYWVILPPGKDDDPELDLDDRVTQPKVEVPKHITISAVILQDGTRRTDGEVDLPFDGFGHGGSHIVYLRNEIDMLICVKFNALLGIVDYFVTEEEFARF